MKDSCKDCKSCEDERTCTRALQMAVRFGAPREVMTAMNVILTKRQELVTMAFHLLEERLGRMGFKEREPFVQVYDHARSLERQLAEKERVDAELKALPQLFAGRFIDYREVLDAIDKGPSHAEIIAQWVLKKKLFDLFEYALEKLDLLSDEKKSYVPAYNTLARGIEQLKMSQAAKSGKLMMVDGQAVIVQSVDPWEQYFNSIVGGGNTDSDDKLPN
jgi:hypothetical protein